MAITNLNHLSKAEKDKLFWDTLNRSRSASRKPAASGGTRQTRPATKSAPPGGTPEERAEQVARTEWSVMTTAERDRWISQSVYVTARRVELMQRQKQRGR